VYGYVRGSAPRGAGFSPTLLVDIDAVIDKKLRMMCCHESQFLEWIPYSQGRLDEVPKGKAAQRRWIADMWSAWLRPLADKYRELLVSQYGRSRGQRVKFAEAVAISPFGSPLDEHTSRRLFPFAHNR
jgi:hypothetical protein